MLRASTPGGHPLIRLAWLTSAGLLIVGAWLVVFGAGRPGLLTVGIAGVLFLSGYLAYLQRHAVFVQRVTLAEEALDRGELERARSELAPLLERFTDVAIVQRAAGLATYALGDPLAASSLLERGARSFRDDPKLAATLVASYAALNRGGDARRAAAIAPKHADVQLALAWSELVALGGDRTRGVAMARDLTQRADVRASAARRAMAAALSAVARARETDEELFRRALAMVDEHRGDLVPYERAFLGYLEGVALRERGAVDEARRAFERAMDEAPGTIGEALARRERANLLARLAADSESARSGTSSSGRSP